MVPCVGASIDRRCRNIFLEKLSDKNVCAMICLACARVLPYDASDSSCEVAYHKLFTNDLFLHMPRDSTQTILGFENFLDKFGLPNLDGAMEASTHEGVDMRNNMQQFEGWTLQVPFSGGDVSVLCCPEDLRCVGDHGEGVVCEMCEAPVCRECLKRFKKNKLPRYGLTNDMWIGQMHEFVFEKKVTIMELLCASPVHAAVLCYQLHQQHSSKLSGQKRRSSFNEPAQFAERTTRAWGNVTAFMSKWEHILTRLHNVQDVELPHVDDKLVELITVIVYTQREFNGNEPEKELTQEELDDMKRIVATSVRRKVVIDLIQIGVDSGHPAWRCVHATGGMAEVHKRAMSLPDGDSEGNSTTPSCVFVNMKKFQSEMEPPTGKAATPSNAPTSRSNVFDAATARGVSDDLSSHAGQDKNARQVSAFISVAQQLAGEAAVMDVGGTLNVTHGPMLTQITPLYMVIVYPYLYPNGSGVPDIFHFKHREDEDNRIDLVNHYSKIIMQRAEAHHRRDMSFPHALWQYVFKTIINIGQHIKESVREGIRQDGEEDKYTSADFSAAANEICEGLRGHWLTPGGARMPVKGDMQNLHHLDPPLGTLAGKMLRDFQATSRSIPGSQEIRTMMRREGEAFRTIYGQHIFATLSPNDRQSLINIRMSRTLRSDPMRKHCEDTKAWTNLDTPSLETQHEANKPDEREEASVDVPLSAVLGSVPSMEVQQKLLARDPLASVYGFRIIVRIILQALFGVRACSNCPDCSNSSECPCSCVDEFGSVASPEGGIAGLLEAYHGGIESQGQTGSLHVHMCMFVARIHQQTKLVDIARMIQEQGEDLVKQFERFSNHMDSSTYSNVERFHARQACY